MTGFHQSNMCHAKTNELVGRLAESEESVWTYFGRLHHEREKKLRDPQDVLIEADRLPQQVKKHRGQATRNSATITRRSPRSSPSRPLGPSARLICPGRERFPRAAPDIMVWPTKWIETCEDTPL
jgi:hypothetical protein